MQMLVRVHMGERYARYLGAAHLLFRLGCDLVFLDLPRQKAPREAAKTAPKLLAGGRHQAGHGRGGE
jgi:hypothetical protein